MGDNDDGHDDDGFDGYVEDTVDPGIWLLLFTTVFCFFIMLVVMPVLVHWTVRRRKRKQQLVLTEPMTLEEPSKEEVTISARTVVAPDNETKKILGLAIPFTVSASISSVLSNASLILVSRFVGTKAVTAYAIVQILVGLSDGFLTGPISACTTLCSQAVGAANSKLAGEYAQLALSMYIILFIPSAAFWWFYMYEVIYYLEWGDEETALLSQDFVRVYIWSYLVSAVSSSLWQLMEITDHAVASTFLGIAWSATNVLVVGILVTTQDEVTLSQVGMVSILTSIFFVILTYKIADSRGWISPFKEGLFHRFALKNTKAVKLMLKQAVPLSIGSLLSNAEWAVLTFFASYLGAAEVAAWAILGSIWGVFYSTTEGIGDAAEIRVAYHLGENHPAMAQLSSYKSLLLGMSVASVVSIIYFSLQDNIPGWFTVDETLQAMLRELVPFVGVANITMTFGMQCWSLLGAQGRYKLATWVSFVASWGVTMPLAAIFTYGFRIDLQGLTSAVVIGYVSTGATLSFILLSTNWQKVARTIRERNAETFSGEAAPVGERDDDWHAEEELYASLQTRSNAAKASARRNIRLLTVPPTTRTGIMIGNVYARKGNYVLLVRENSPLYGRVHPGDSLLAINEEDVSSMAANEVTAKLKNCIVKDRDLAFVAPLTRLDENGEVLFEAVAEDASSERESTSEGGHDFGLWT